MYRGCGYKYLCKRSLSGRLVKRLGRSRFTQLACKADGVDGVMTTKIRMSTGRRGTAGWQAGTSRVRISHSDLNVERTADWAVLPPDSTRIDRCPQSKDTRGSVRPTGQTRPEQKTGDMCPPHPAGVRGSRG